MKFILQDIPDITVPVRVQVPGAAEVSVLNARWKLYDYEGAHARTESMKAGNITDEQLITEDLLELGPIYTPDGEEVPYTLELALQLLKKTYVRIPLTHSWISAQACRVEAATKN